MCHRNVAHKVSPTAASSDPKHAEASRSNSRKLRMHTRARTATSQSQSRAQEKPKGAAACSPAYSLPRLSASRPGIDCRYLLRLSSSAYLCLASSSNLSTVCHGCRMVLLRPGCLLSLPPLTSSTVKSKTQPGNRKHNHDTRTVKKCPVLRLPPGCEA